ncbi:MAG: hypothetical protein AB1801_00515 [Chloroflexota bacterium]
MANTQMSHPEDQQVVESGPKSSKVNGAIVGAITAAIAGPMTTVGALGAAHVPDKVMSGLVANAVIAGLIIGAIIGAVSVATDKKLIMKNPGGSFGLRVGSVAAAFTGIVYGFILGVGLVEIAAWLLTGAIFGAIAGAIVGAIYGAIVSRRQ